MTNPTTRTVLRELIAAAKLTSEGREFPLGHLDDVRESAEQHIATLSDASDDGDNTGPDWQRRYEDIKRAVVKNAGSPATLATVLLLLFKQHRQEK